MAYFPHIDIQELLVRKEAYEGKSGFQIWKAIKNRETPSIPTFDQLIHQVASKNIFQNLVQICLSCWECEPKKRIDVTEILVHLSKSSRSTRTSTLESPPVDPKQRIDLIIKNTKLLNSTKFYSSILIFLASLLYLLGPEQSCT